MYVSFVVLSVDKLSASDVNDKFAKVEQLAMIYIAGLVQEGRDL